MAPNHTPTVAAAPARLRMYNVGFGDCFLLWIPTAEGERTVLVDCGVHMGGIANKISAVVADVVSTVSTNGRARIDVVIATHRHFDHISGFDNAAWRDVEVGEVWLPWTEDPDDDKARKLRKSQHRLASVLAKRNPDTNTPQGWLALNSLSNKGAERTLQKGFAGSPTRRYLPHPDRAQRTFKTTALPGVTVHAMGPSYDEGVIATLDPPAGKYFPFGLAAYERDERPALAADPLFRAELRMRADEYEEAYPHLVNFPREELQELADENDLAAAAALEDAINGTSLVLVLEFDHHRLLLAGDAEWGTWQEILADDGWCDVLRKTSVYKVAHHGSYNGTPRSFVEDLLPDDATSLVSLRHVKRWPSIPRASLLGALSTGQRTLIRSDDLADAAPQCRRSGDLWIEIDIP